LETVLEPSTSIAPKVSWKMLRASDSCGSGGGVGGGRRAGAGVRWQRDLLDLRGEVQLRREVHVLAEPADKLDHRDFAVAVRVQLLRQLRSQRPAAAAGLVLSPSLNSVDQSPGVRGTRGHLKNVQGIVMAQDMMVPVHRAVLAADAHPWRQSRAQRTISPIPFRPIPSEAGPALLRPNIPSGVAGSRRYPPCPATGEQSRSSILRRVPHL